MAITPLPLYSGTAPIRTQDQASFNANMANWISYTTTFQPSYNTFASEANALALEVEGYKSLSLTYSNNSAASAAESLASRDMSASSANYIGLWSLQTGSKSAGVSVFHIGSYWRLNVNLANVALSEPSLTNTDWQFISGTRWQPERTTDFTVAKNAYETALITTSRNATLSAFGAGDFFCVMNDPASTANLTIVKTGVTVQSPIVTVATGDNITLRPGQTFYAKASSTTALKVPNNG